MYRALTGTCSIFALATLATFASGAEPDPGPPTPDSTYRPLPTAPFAEVKAMDEADKPQIMQRQEALL
ncbi:MAG TPA: hypothetical protein GX696_03530, partial [Pseudomonadaceae bacterium]|nr:hypothetical protein [Pseudomonadaceae bacterium]